MKNLIIAVLSIFAFSSVAYGAFSAPFVSIQLAGSPVNGNCLTTNGTANAWGACSSGSFNPFTNPSLGVAASTTNFIWGSSLTASSTIIGNFNITGNSTTTNATTTKLFSSLGNFNTLCIALDCKTAWPTSLTSYDAWTHPVAGTSATTSNIQITGASTTLQAFTYTNATGTSATTTNFFSTTASSTNLFGQLINGFGLATCSNGVTWASGSFGCAASAPVTSVTATWPIISSGGATPALTWGGLATTSAIAAGGNILYATGVNTFASAATGTVSCTSGLTCTASRFVIGGALSITGAFDPFTRTAVNNAATTSALGIGTTTPWAQLSVSTSTQSAPTTNLFQVASTTGANLFLVQGNGTTLSNGTSTNWFATTASSTNLFGQLINGFGLSTCNGANQATTWAAGSFGCTTISASGGSFDPFTHAAVNSAATTSAIGIGTTTPWSQLSISTSTQSSSLTSLFEIASTTGASILRILGGGFSGFASSTPQVAVSVGSGTASTTILVAEYAFGASGNVATSTAYTFGGANLPSNHIRWPIGTSATTFTLCMLPGQQFTVWVSNPNGTAGAITWTTCAGNQLNWPSGTIPTQTTTANKYDVWSFLASYDYGTPATSTKAVIISGAASLAY